MTNEELKYVAVVEDDLKNSVRHSKPSLEKLAAHFGIVNKNLVKELTELAIVRVTRYIAHCKLCPDTGKEPTIRNKFDRIVDLYHHQANLSMRTSESMLLQQYSTPAPIAFVAGSYCLQGIHGNYEAFEPSAGNGLLTIAFDPEKCFVNEIDDVRLRNLDSQGFKKVTSINGVNEFWNYGGDNTYHNKQKGFDMVITNPPFGNISKPVSYGLGEDNFQIGTLDHLMALRALDMMKDSGRAAIIIGGHTKWDERGRVQAGKNRLFLNYLYRYYLVDDVLNIDGHKLYSRQGTAFDVRLILISGRKAVYEGAAPLKQSKDVVIEDFDTLYGRVIGSNSATNSTTTATTTRAKALMLKLKMLQLQ